MSIVCYSERKWRILGALLYITQDSSAMPQNDGSDIQDSSAMPQNDGSDIQDSSAIASEWQLKYAILCQ